MIIVNALFAPDPVWIPLHKALYQLCSSLRKPDSDGMYDCSGMGIPPPQTAAPAAAAVDASALTAALQATMQTGPAARTGPALEDVLTPDALLPLLHSPDVMSRLAPHMPAEHRCAALCGLAGCSYAGQAAQPYRDPHV